MEPFPLQLRWNILLTGSTGKKYELQKRIRQKPLYSIHHIIPRVRYFLRKIFHHYVSWFGIPIFLLFRMKCMNILFSTDCLIVRSFFTPIYLKEVLFVFR